MQVNNSKKKELLHSIITLVSFAIFAYSMGLITRDRYLLGATTLLCGMIQVYLTEKGLWYKDVVTILENFFTAVVCVMGHLYGTAIFMALIYLPLSIFALVNWKKNSVENIVIVKRMNIKQSILAVGGIVVVTAVISGLLSLIPNQNLSFLDSFCNVLNATGILLFALRYKEGFFIYIITNIVDFITWVSMASMGNLENSPMMIITSIVYLILNIWGLIKFIKLGEKQEKDAQDSLIEKPDTSK